MSRLIFAAFAFMVLFSVATACPPNEEHQDCGTACEPTCQKPGPQPCTLQCVSKCFCKDGLVRNSKGRCIPEDECDCDN